VFWPSYGGRRHGRGWNWLGRRRLERFSHFYVASPVLLKVVFTSTPSSKDHSLERFRFKCLHRSGLQGGFFLRKKPLGSIDSVEIRSETAVGAPEMKKPLSDCSSLHTNGRTAINGGIRVLPPEDGYRLKMRRSHDRWLVGGAGAIKGCSLARAPDRNCANVSFTCARNTSASNVQERR